MRWAGSVFAADRPRHPDGVCRPAGRRRSRPRARRRDRAGERGSRHAALPARRARPALGRRRPRGLPRDAASTTPEGTSSGLPSRASPSSSRPILDGLESVQPVASIRATGGVFRSALWREVLAGVLGRPLTVTAGAEGSALGAAALGLEAVGARGSLESALSALAPTCSSPARPRRDVVASPASAAAYDLARVSAAQRLRDLAAAADLLAGPRRALGGQPAATHRQQAATRCRRGPPRAFTRATHHPRCLGPQRSSAP